MVDKILWSPEALEDLETLTAYIAAVNVRAAISTGRAILCKTRTIPRNLQAGRIVPERSDPCIREVFHGNYRIIYRLLPPTDRIEIMRIWHGARGAPQVQS
jgi:toxin ParE1/3/4